MTAYHEIDGREVVIDFDAQRGSPGYCGNGPDGCGTSTIDIEIMSVVYTDDGENANHLRDKHEDELVGACYNELEKGWEP